MVQVQEVFLTYLRSVTSADSTPVEMAFHMLPYLTKHTITEAIEAHDMFRNLLFFCLHFVIGYVLHGAGREHFRFSPKDALTRRLIDTRRAAQETLE
jgi:hypothetical protein